MIILILIIALLLLMQSWSIGWKKYRSENVRTRDTCVWAVHSVPHLCLIHNQNTKLGLSVISLPESPASESQIYTGDSQGLRLLLTTSGLHLANDKM